MRILIITAALLVVGCRTTEFSDLKGNSERRTIKNHNFDTSNPETIEDLRNLAKLTSLRPVFDKGTSPVGVASGNYQCVKLSNMSQQSAVTSKKDYELITSVCSLRVLNRAGERFQFFGSFDEGDKSYAFHAFGSPMNGQNKYSLMYLATDRINKANLTEEITLVNPKTGLLLSKLYQNGKQVAYLGYYKVKQDLPLLSNMSDLNSYTQEQLMNLFKQAGKDNPIRTPPMGESDGLGILMRNNEALEAVSGRTGRRIDIPRFTNFLTSQMWTGKIYFRNQQSGKVNVINKAVRDRLNIVQGDVGIMKLGQLESKLANLEVDEYPSLINNYAAHSTWPNTLIVGESRLVNVEKRIYLGRIIMQGFNKGTFLGWFAMEFPHE